MTNGSNAGLLGRQQECDALDDLLADARAGHSAALVVRGEAGIGKTELLKYLLDRAVDCRILRAAGVESEMEFSYAGLHQLCIPLLSNLKQLPGPQGDALSTAFGLRSGQVPDRFLIGLATLSLLADAGGDKQLMCVIDDAQWLDQASALTLAFVARRLVAESVVMVFAVREPASGPVLDGVPELWVGGLPLDASRELLDSVLPDRLDKRVRERILAEAQGNPLALLEFPRGVTALEAATGLVGAEELTMPGQLERGFLQRVQDLPEDTRRLLSTAAADPFGDVILLRLRGRTPGNRRRFGGIPSWSLGPAHAREPSALPAPTRALGGVPGDTVTRSSSDPSGAGGVH